MPSPVGGDVGGDVGGEGGEAGYNASGCARQRSMLA
jgi:hypothetical protein